MSYYTERNGLANLWNHDHTRLELAKWVYHHPEDFETLLELILQSPEITSNTTIMTPMSDADIDNITGVRLNG